MAFRDYFWRSVILWVSYWRCHFLSLCLCSWLLTSIKLHLMWKDAVLSDFKYNLDIWPEELTIATSVRRKWLSRHMSGGTIPASVWRNYTSVCPEEVTISAYVRRNYSCVCLEELYQRLSGGTDYSYVCPEELTIPTFVQRNRLFWHLPGENDNPDVCPGKQKKNNKNYQSELFFSSHFRITAQEGVFPCAKAPCSEDVLVNEI